MSATSLETKSIRPDAIPPSHVGLPALARRLVEALPREARLELALQLIETEAAEITFRREEATWTGFPWDRIVSGTLFIYGSYQKPETQAVLLWMQQHLRLASPRAIIIDIGANIGTTTIPFARQSDCRVLAIEPIPEVFAVLCRNVADNGLCDRVVTIQSAILRTGNDHVLMILPQGNSGAGEVARANQPPTFAGQYSVRSQTWVPATGLDQLLDRHGVAVDQVAFVWADAQGSEVDVIETGPSLWKAGVPLYAEFDPRTWRNEKGRESIVAAAARHFAGFIPVEDLIATADPAIRPIVKLGAYSQALGPFGSDVLLLPERSAGAR